MKTKTLPLAIAIAACSFDLQAADADNNVWLQLTPAGHFAPSDGRPMDVPAWYIDGATAEQVISRFKVKRTPPVIDYEHQTLLKEENGQPAPAAGRIRAMEWREGQGLFARVELTARAAQYIADREYLYFSPVFLFHPTTGHVLDVQMGALTNHPAIDGMQELSLRAAATFGLHLDPTEETHVNKLHLAVLAALGLAATTTEEQAIAALSAHTANLRKALGADETATGDALIAACTGLKAKAAATAEPDPAKYVPVTVLDEVKGQIAVLTAQLTDMDAKGVDAEIAAALEDGRLLKPMEPWARDLAKKDRAALTAYLAASAPIAALAASQTQGKAPVVDATTGLSAEEQAVCTSMGITAEAFKQAKGA